MRNQFLYSAAIWLSSQAVCASAKDCNLLYDAREYYTVPDQPQVHFMLSVKSAFFRAAYNATSAFALILQNCQAHLEVDTNSSHHESSCWSRAEGGTFLLPRSGKGQWTGAIDYDDASRCAAVSESQVDLSIQVNGDLQPWKCMADALDTVLKNTEPSDSSIVFVLVLVMLSVAAAVCCIGASCPSDNRKPFLDYRTGRQYPLPAVLLSALSTIRAKLTQADRQSAGEGGLLVSDKSNGAQVYGGF